MDDFRHAGEVYNHLETVLKHYTRDEDAEVLCKGLHDLGFWVSLPHEVIERAYQVSGDGRWSRVRPRASPCFPVCLRAHHHATPPPTYPFLQDRNIPDRYCTVALMAENRFLIQANEKLAAQVETLTEALKSETQRGMGGPGGER